MKLPRLRFIAFFSSGLLGTVIFAGVAHAASVLPPEAAAFQDWRVRYDAAANDAGRQSLIGEGVAAARARRAVLRELIQADPQMALTVSRSISNADRLPPAVRSEMETSFATNGDYVIEGVLAASGGPKVEPLRRHVRLGDQSYSAYVFGSRLGGSSQFNVPLEGIALDGMAAVDDAAPAPGKASPNALTPWTSGAKNVLIIRVDFSDKTGDPEGLSSATVQSVADTQVAPYYARSSYGLTSLSNTVTSNVYRMPQTAAYYATNGANDTLHTDAENAASADYAVSSYDRIIVFFSSLGGISGSQITYGGLAQIGAKDVWCNGEFDFRVIAHELGHTYGLYHGNLWQVSDGNPISTNGVDTEYGDDFETMGANFANSQATDFGPWFKNILGWVADSQVTTVTNSGTYRVYAFDHDNYLSAPGENVALRIVKDSTHNYWISCRRDFTTDASLTNGVYVQWGYNYTRQSDLLDMTTPGNSDQDAGLFTGAIFTDTAAANGQGVTIHPLDTGGTDPNDFRDVQVTFGTAPPLAPIFTMLPQGQSGVLGQTASFTVQASGNPAPGYQWQRKAVGGPAWANVVNGGNYSGAATASLTVALNDVGQSGDQFQCVATNSQGSTNSAPAATLTVTSGLVVTTLAGQAGNPGTMNGTGTNTQFYYPFDVACDAAGNVYVAQYYNGLVREITPAGNVSTYASGFYAPEGVAVDSRTNVYVSDTFHQQIQRISPGGAVTPLAGSAGVAGAMDGTNTDALFSDPWGIAVDSQTNIFVADSSSNIIRKVSRVGSTENWAVTTIAGLAGFSGANDGTNSVARFNAPAGLACDASNIIYVADAGNNAIRKIIRDASGTNWAVSTITPGTGGNALLDHPTGVAVDTSSNIYVADAWHNLIRVLSTNGLVTTIAGGNAGSADGFYTGAAFNSPYGIAVDRFGNIYIADTFNHTVRVAHWAQVTVPSLSIARSGGSAIVSWPVAVSPFRLLSRTNLAVSNWTAVGTVPWTVTNNNITTNPATGPAMFFRLVNP